MPLSLANMLLFSHLLIVVKEVVSMSDNENKSDLTQDKVVTLFLLGGTAIFAMFMWAFFILHSIG